MKRFLSILILAGALLTSGSLSCHAAEAVWFNSYDQAVHASEKNGRPILIDFTGSDWCPPCMKLEADVFSKPEFIAYAADHYVLLRADFPSDRKNQPVLLQAANEELAKKYHIEAFPTLLILGDHQQILQTAVGYPQGGFSDVMAMLKKFQKS